MIESTEKTEAVRWRTGGFRGFRKIILNFGSLFLFRVIVFRQQEAIGRVSNLLHSNAFCEIARFIDVAAAGDGDVVGEELEGDGSQERVDGLDGLGNVNDVIGHLRDLLVAFGG